MTTFDDTGMFELVDGDRTEPTPSHRGRVAVVLVVAAALVAGGVTWLLAGRGDDPAQAEAVAVALLTRPVQPTDALDAAVVDETGIDPSSTRFAVRTTAGLHYAALRWSGDLCLVVVPDGDVPRAVCAPPSATASVTLSGRDGSRVRLSADGAPLPDAREAWRPAGPNLWVLDAPAAG